MSDKYILELFFKVTGEFFCHINAAVLSTGAANANCHINSLVGFEARNPAFE